MMLTPAGDAEILAQRHPDSGSDLYHHPLLGVVEGAPRRADLVVDGDSAGGADGGALAAAYALRLLQLPVEGRHDLQLAAPEGEVQNALSLQLLAHADTVTAEMHLLGSRNTA